MKANKPTAEQIFNRLTKLYLIALVAVAVISLIGQVLIQTILNELLDDSHLVNIAGRQRMFSQKITKRSLLIYNAQQKGENLTRQKEILVKDLARWTTNHVNLSNRSKNNQLFILNNNSLKIRQLYNQLQPKFDSIANNVKRIILAKQDQSIEKPLQVIIANESGFLELMNKIVEEYDNMAKEKVNRTRLFEMFLFSLLLFVLIIEAVFIFKPIAHQIKLSVNELTTSQLQIEQANEILQKTNKKLEETTKELVKTNKEKIALKDAEEKIRTMALVSGQEQERKRLSRELHDGIGQMLSGIRLQVEHINGTKFNSDKQKQAIDELKQLIGETIETTRAVSYNLAPSVLSDFGLNAALKLLVDQYTKASNIRFGLDYTVQNRLAEIIETALYRIVQESVNNATKHAKATKIDISLAQTNQKLVLTVADNGVGFDIKTPKTGKISDKNGLKNMKTRSEMINGKFEIKSKIGEGTKITVTVPVTEETLA